MRRFSTASLAARRQGRGDRGGTGGLGEVVPLALPAAHGVRPGASLLGGTGRRPAADRMLWLGRLEALLARHWPEATRVPGTELGDVVADPGASTADPAALAADAEAANGSRAGAAISSRARRSSGFVQVAGRSVGVRQTAVDRRRMQECATAALSAKHEVQQASATLEKLAQGQATIARQAAVVGWATACVLWVHLGDPANYHCAEAYRKAMGLNLKERSSGRYQGQLKITKRGPGAVRRWLYFAAMRLVQKAEVAEWYAVKKGQRAKGGKRALIAVMRKLALGLYALGVGEEPFDARRLFSAAVSTRTEPSKKKKKKKKKTIGELASCGSATASPGFRRRPAAHADADEAVPGRAHGQRPAVGVVGAPPRSRRALRARRGVGSRRRGAQRGRSRPRTHEGPRACHGPGRAPAVVVPRAAVP